MFVVICIDYRNPGPNMTTYVGPFYDREPAEAYCEHHNGHFDRLAVQPLAQPPKMDAVHPDQAQIGDYIDPSVAN